MERQLTRGGKPLVLHRPNGPELGAHPGVTFRTPEDIPMASKAERDGVYTLDGNRFFIAAGDPLPKGAVVEGEEPAAERKQDQAPENKSKKAAPENKAAKGAPESKAK